MEEEQDFLIYLECKKNESTLEATVSARSQKSYDGGENRQKSLGLSWEEDTDFSDFLLGSETCVSSTIEVENNASDDEMPELVFYEESADEDDEEIELGSKRKKNSKQVLFLITPRKRSTSEILTCSKCNLYFCHF